jgi:hypothetical protein
MNALRIAIVASVCASLLGGTLCGPEQESLPYVQWIGDSSGHEAGFVLARDESQWRALWAAHSGVPAAHGAMKRHAAPEVNFERCLVVAYFRGPTTNEDGEVVRAVDETADAVRVRFSAHTFQTASFDGTGGAVSTTPFGIWVLPLTDKPIVIEEGRTGLKADPLTWREVHRFEGR